ncbi:Fcf2 pre-rRNA processing-domain-containing protein [Gamsiella multidivaricata]|uniref:Fcf2 pre-rRNA processing-domain-containing protein n=1 Tax=Gamsiella multidivaricata TaxID=101098 RepID=UPI00221F3558|nr:Fcf2 pre-rRNA processing-domain-containing protein [Gamsiella multidivaricata]KAG0359997.1 hypothetical protein BGZ54_009741 [Gamsiella multidivaricata]KAI7823259.1 Fcf2 pre-rRNA processing-domain-containing protein [Gamsiella multidivaricata]
MVTTRNRSRKGLTSPEPLELSLPTRARRTRQTKTKADFALEEEESETVESSSPTSTIESSSPPRELNEVLFDGKSAAGLHEPEVISHSNNVHLKQEEDTHDETDQEEYRNDVEGEQENGYEDEESEKDQGLEEGEESEEEDRMGTEDSNDEDLDQLLVKAQESFKRKAMLGGGKEEPRFSFPRLETGLDTKNVYIKQDGTRAKVDMSTIIVVEKGAAGSNPSGGQATLETCEVNMNAHNIHISKKQRKEDREKTAGKSWFDLPQQTLTPELKRDLQILKLRNVLDPKRFYKREEKGKPKFPKYFQVGTIIEGNTEFYSSRLTKKERATTITGEVMKDLAGRDYYKRKFNEIQETKQSGGKRFYKKGNGKQSKGWRAGK